MVAVKLPLMSTTTRRSPSDALDRLAQQIGPHLRTGIVRRSLLEGALATIGADAQVRALALQALASASIRVLEDVTTPVSAVETGVEPRRVSRPAPAPSPAVIEQDPVAAGRRRLELDRLRPPSTRHRVILTAIEEVGLTLIARPDGEPLPKGGFARLEGEAREAAEAMVLHNLRLAHSVARAHAGHGLEHDDLHASAVVGLLRAVELFDPAAGHKFSTYATHWLRQSVTRAIANESRLIRIPVHMHERVRGVAAERERLTLDGVRPSRHVLARACHLTVPQVLECLRLLSAVLSLETPLGQDGLTLGDVVAPRAPEHDEVEVQGLCPEDVEPLLSLVDLRAAEVLRMRFGLSPHEDCHTLEQIGQRFGVTRERIRQVEAKAMERIRAHLRNAGHTVPARGDGRDRLDGS